MQRALQTAVVPALRERGFTGSFPHFRRITDEKTDLLTFQFDRYGGGFVLAIAERRPGQFTGWRENVPASKLTAFTITPPNRCRLQPGSGGDVESWFRYDDGQEPAQLAAQVLEYLPEADAWWTGQRKQPHLR